MAKHGRHGAGNAGSTDIMPESSRSQYGQSPNARPAGRQGAGTQGAGRQDAGQYSRSAYGSRQQDQQRYARSGYGSQQYGGQQRASQAGGQQRTQRGYAQQAGGTQRTPQQRPAQQGYAPQDRTRPRSQAQAGYGAPSQEAAQYSRVNYGAGSGHGAHGKGKRKGKLGTPAKVGIVIGCIVLALLLAAGAYVLWFSSSLNKLLAPSSQELTQVSDELANVPIDQPFYMLILGSDSREGSGTSEDPTQSGDQQRSDVMILARIDPQKNAVTLVTIPRDTQYVRDDGTVIKINEAYNYGGAAESIKAISKLVNRPIAHYAVMYISDLESLVDALGGVEVYVDRELSVKDTLTGEIVYLDAGDQVLNGKQAQVFARARHEYDEEENSQDYYRQNNVRTLVQAIARTALHRPVTELPGTILTLAEYVTTDLKSGDLLSLALSFNDGDMDMYSCTGPSDGKVYEQYDGQWMCYPNPAGWEALMAEVDKGEDPAEIDYAATQVTD